MIPPGKKSLSRGSQNKSNEKVKTFKIDVSQPTSKSRLVPIHSSVLLGQETNYTRLWISKQNTKKAFFLLRCLNVKGGVPSFFWERGEETRSGTEKPCSHNLQSGHPAWWSAGNRCSSEPAEEMIKTLKT